MGNVEIPKWLKGLSLAPEFRPTDTEFADPIAYISKIEKEASAFGICKIIPPLPKPSKRYVFHNLNKSLSRSPELGDDVTLSNSCSSLNTGEGDGGNDGEVRAVFTTRNQELGQGVKRAKGAVKESLQLDVNKQVWQSGEIYTLEQFESKSKAFARNLLGMIKEINATVIEALFWKAASDKPIQVEYANDVPGSGFGEPEGQFRYFHRRRRKRASYQSYRRRKDSSDCKKNEMDVVNSHGDDVKGALVCKNDPSVSLETTPKSTLTSSMPISDEILSSSKRKSVNPSNDMEGTAGWKLSNSPWNLQVIARSPGSITRFMPDDIPGVTSPMVYIGMLFSWFAWHVEDHELHSMNFLHTGSSKTWYAVPGDYAFAFEEVIRTEAYGGSIDRLAALTRLGEKTTLLSPEVIVSSGIPCCRLIQNPGEFVVTFPRAYHVGFSHGFNCGEAANFGTPQWLKVAKEAAVRRAAMNYLPMLSHQQLLYLLTMSFASRVPRTLLPGARSSRLRDRLKEERELSVKKAFLEDVLKENNILSALLGKGPANNVVIWNPDLLPCANKECQQPSVIATVATNPTDNVSHVESENNTNSHENDLLKEMKLYMETVNDLYVVDDDLSCDFQVDSGTLACVGCGILGYPFMSVLQPAERASTELLPDHPIVGRAEVKISENSHSFSELDDTSKGSVLDSVPMLDLSLPQKDLPMPRGWNTASKFLRPRIFCLEHAVQVQELLQSKGGANMLMICHSDYLKIKAHVTAIAEEIDIPFKYEEVSLESASQEELNLIDLAVDDENCNEFGEDWTSKLGINLQYCVKTRKNSPSKQVHHALALGGLFSDETPRSDLSNIKWQSRRSRSKIKLNHPSHSKPCDGVKINTSKVLRKESESVVFKNEEKLIQYRRKKFKVNLDTSTNDSQGCPRRHLAEASVASCENLDKLAGNVSETNPCNIWFLGSDSSGLGLPPVGMSEMLHEVQVLERTDTMTFDSAPSEVADSRITATIVGQFGNQPLSESKEEGNVCNAAACSSSEMKLETKAPEKMESYAKKCSSPCLTVADEKVEIQREDPRVEEINVVNERCNLVSEEQRKFLADTNVSVSDVPDLAYPSSSCVSHPSMTQLKNIVVQKSFSGNIGCAHMNFGNEMQQEALTMSRSSDERCITCDDITVNQRTASIEKCRELPRTICAAEEKVQHVVEISSQCNREEHGNFRPQSRSAQASADDNSAISSETYAATKECSGVNSGNDMQQLVEIANESKEECLSSSVTQIEVHQHTPISMEEFSVLTGMSSVEKGLRHELTGVVLGIPATVKDNEVCPAHTLASIESMVVGPKSTNGKARKRKSELEQITESKFNCNVFIRSPCEGLRPRAGKDATSSELDSRKSDQSPVTKKARKPSDVSVPRPKIKESAKRPHKCDLEGCRMSFETKAELLLHKRNRCPYEGCRKRFSSHKYAIIHQRVHEDDRPLKCPWDGCTMSFKWAWARTEHIRVHTGEKPYQCKVEGCGLSFRFVSDFSRHRRKSGHYVDSPA